MCLSVIKNANLPKEKRDLARATVPDLTFESIKKQIKAIYDQCSASEKKKVESTRDEIQVESEVYYGQGRGPWRHGPFHGNTRSRDVNVRNRNTGGSFSPTRQEGLYPERVTGILLVEMRDQHNVILAVPSIISFFSVLAALKIRNQLPRNCILAT